MKRVDWDETRLPDGMRRYTGDVKEINSIESVGKITKYYQLHGPGTAWYHDGRVYEGYFREGEYHGDGKLVQTGPNGWEYKGKFFNGAFSRYGFLRTQRLQYRGSFSNGKFHGQVFATN